VARYDILDNDFYKQTFVIKITFSRRIAALTLISHSLSRTDSWVSKVESEDGLTAALDTTTSIFPYF
jgi:hypothetical protein